MMKFETLLDAFRKGGNDTPYVSLKGRQAHIEEQFEHYGIDMCDVLQLFKQKSLHVRPLEESDDDQYEIQGHTIDGESMALIVSTNGYTIKIINVWLV